MRLILSTLLIILFCVYCVKHFDSSTCHLKHCVRRSCESPVLSPCEFFKLCNYCISIYDVCSISSSSVSLGQVKSLQMMHGDQVFPTCYQLGEFSICESFIIIHSSSFVFDSRIDLRSNHFHRGENDRDIKLFFGEWSMCNGLCS